MQNTTTVEIGLLKRLQEAEIKLTALESAGVDNWDGYEDALAEFLRNKDKETAIQDCLEDMEVFLFESAYEPSERGAGFAASESGRERADKRIRQLLEQWYS